MVALVVLTALLVVALVLLHFLLLAIYTTKDMKDERRNFVTFSRANLSCSRRSISSCLSAITFLSSASFSSKPFFSAEFF